MIIVETDDLCPASMHKFKYWLELKKKFPKLKLTAWVPACWQDKDENNILKNKEFRLLWLENKKWLEFHPHGYLHDKPPECQRDYKEQKFIINQSLGYLMEYIKLNPAVGWKCPFYKISEDTLKILKKLDFSFYQNCWKIVPLKPVKNYTEHNIPFHQGPFLISTHTSPLGEGCPDDISLSETRINIESLLRNLEAYKFEYLTMGEYISRLIK